VSFAAGMRRQHIDNTVPRFAAMVGVSSRADQSAKLRDSALTGRGLKPQFHPFMEAAPCAFAA
jgi:hypothetical protein